MAGTAAETRLTGAWVAQVLPPRQAAAHKGSFGTLGILAGCSRYRGAAVLAAAGAARAGTGIVRVASVEPVCAAVAASLPGCTLLPLPQAGDGTIAPEGAALLLKEKQTAILAGCGLGQNDGTAALVWGLLRETPCPLVLDADALNLLAHPAHAPVLGPALGAAGAPVVLTPHIGEMARLCGQSPAWVQQNQRRCALDHAQTTGCVVVLKSHHTWVAGPTGACFVNDGQGNPGMAKGGSGDVLAGIIGGLLAQGVPALQAAAAGVWLHAAAGDAAARRHGQDAMLPADMPPLLGEVFRGLGRE